MVNCLNEGQDSHNFMLWKNWLLLLSLNFRCPEVEVMYFSGVSPQLDEEMQIW